MMFDMEKLITINDQNYLQHLEGVGDGPGGLTRERKSRGLMPRDWQANPQGCFAFAPSFPDELIIPESEWQDRLDQQNANKSSLADLRELYGIRSLDQDGYGYCWAFSSTKACMYVRAREGQPIVELSAWAVGAIIKNYRNEGGWGSESLEFIAKVGVPSLSVWPQGAVRRDLDTPEMRANAALHKFTEWWDGSEDRAKAKRQMVTAFLLGLPCVLDFNWWSHSVCGIALVSINPFKILIDNSWGSGWSDRGMGILEGSKAVPDGLWVPRVSTVSGAT